MVRRLGRTERLIPVLSVRGHADSECEIHFLSEKETTIKNKSAVSCRNIFKEP